MPLFLNAIEFKYIQPIAVKEVPVSKAVKDPVADNSTKEGRAANRRIEVELLQ